jgi:outer membrane protein assembly factor BamD (BamD/ComL family)
MLPADQVDQTTGGGGAGGATGANATATSAATRTTYALDGSGAWQSASAPAAGSDEAVLARARELLATDRPGAAHKVIDEWLRPRERTDHPLLPQAYLLRADATAADGNEYEALYDYEALIKNFPGAPEYVIALERELDIGVKYLNGVERKFLGVRWVDAAAVGEELLIRIHERLPGSRLAERAGIELADYYYRTRDLPNAAVAYELFLQNHPRSAYTMRARQRQIFSNLGRFKGPRYDSTKLLDSKVLIDRFQRDYPAQAEQLGLDEALAVRIDESSAEQMLDAANWHMARQDIAAARLIMNRLVRRHPQTATAQRVLAELQSRGWLMDEQAAATNTPTGQEAKP